MSSERVLIVGAGPVGVTLALLLGQRGLPVTVLEAETQPIIDYRASTFHPPTMDMLEESGVTTGLLAMGRVCPTFQYRDRREGKIAEFDLGMLKHDTRHPYRVQCEQFKLVEFVLQRLFAMPEVDIRFAHRLDAVTQSAGGVDAPVATPTGTERLPGSWLVGTDGGRSTVRKSLEIEFEGSTYPERFLVAGTTFDFRSAIPDLCSVHYIADADEWVTLLEIPDMWRFIAPVYSGTDGEALSDAFIESRLQGFVPTRHALRHPGARDLSSASACRRDLPARARVGGPARPCVARAGARCGPRRLRAQAQARGRQRDPGADRAEQAPSGRARPGRAQGRRSSAGGEWPRSRNSPTGIFCRHR